MDTPIFQKLWFSTHSIRTFAVVCVILSTAVLAASQSITYIEAPRETQDSVRVIFTINGASNRRIRVAVLGEVDHVVSKEISLSSSGEHIVKINLFEGRNWVSFVVYVNDEPVALRSDANVAVIDCRGRWCKKPFTITPDKVASEYKESVAAEREQEATPQQTSEEANEERQTAANKGQKPRKPAQAEEDVAEAEEGEADKDPPKAITINEPQTKEGKPYVVEDRGSIDAYVTVPDGISNIQYDVMTVGKPGIHRSEVFEVKEAKEKMPLKLEFLKGINTIRIYDADPLQAAKSSTSIMIECKGEKCADNFLVSTVATSSQNTRVIVGIEQAGAASTESTTKPFLDLYFNTPFHFEKNNSELSRLGLWGNVRLASTPDQITATGILPSNLINQVSESSSTTELVQSFDFLAGIEARLKSGGNSYFGLLPGIKQKSHFYLAAGFGAISPLTAKKEAAQIFELPQKGSPQYDAFIQRYGTPDSSKEFIGFVPLDRDRFLRQWYAGFRFKTLYCEDRDCKRYLNRFPAIVDFMFGQNEAVTGGRLKYDVTTLDPATNTQKIIGQKNAYVFRLDAFYPLPIREASFLFLYGTAIMKVGGGGVKIENPIFLNRASGGIQITDSKVFIPAPEFQQLLQPNRDYYRIGVGLNLTELFNRRRSSQ